MTNDNREACQNISCCKKFEMDIAKAGWLYRQSSVLRRWKRNWFVLYVNGDLKYFESPDSIHSEDSIAVRVEIKAVYTGREVDAPAPEGLKKDFLLALHCRDGAIWTLCCESVDDMRAWEISIKQAKHRSPPAYAVHQPEYMAPPPPAYTGNGYPGVVHALPGDQQVYYGQHPQLYSQQYAGQPGTTTIVYRDDPDYYHRHRGYCRRGYDGGDVAMGMVAGAAMGSLMWGPMLWW